MGKVAQHGAVVSSTECWAYAHGPGYDTSMDQHSPCIYSLLQLGRTLVFETVDQGAQYRQYAIKALRASVPDIVTLDGGKLSGRGVVVGSGFRVCSIEDAMCRFGSIPAGQQVGLVGRSH